MSAVMDRLHEEHRNIAKLLRVLEHQLAIFDSAEQPDYDVLSAIAEYFTDFPDRCHHPKEDLIYRRLLERVPDSAEPLMDLEADHRRIGVLARNYREAVQNVLREVEVPRNAFDEVTRLFIREQRQHMQAEEERVFSLALDALTPEDWTEIDAHIIREEDPVFGNDATEAFATLRDCILQWDEADKSLAR